MTAEKYEQDCKGAWNAFNASAKNGLFMFDRNYMEYHSDRFQDASLLFYEENELKAIFPACREGDRLISHGGLTYGGFITDSKCKQHTMHACFEELMIWCRANGIQEIIYKCIPHIFHRQPAEEDRYELFVHSAQILKTEASTVINLENPLKMPKGRKACISKAKREGILVWECTEAEDFYTFLALENTVLMERHDTTAVHTPEELFLLKSRFPQSIHLYAAYLDNEMVAGTVIFEYDTAVHTQYMASGEAGRRIGALDYVISEVIATYKETKRWLDFGISTENGGVFLNEGLISQKEGFGGRTNVYSTWKLKV